MTTAVSPDAFEAYLERAVERLDASSPVRSLVREHFAFGDPRAKRGKRLRPRILLAVAETEGARAEEAFAAAAAVELLHNFSLVHDDIEDGDELRRGRPALWARYGIPAAITAGDAMCALAFTMLLDGAPGTSHAAGAPGAEQALAMSAALHRALYALCRGQGADIGFETSPSVTFGEYLAMIEGKTAALFAASCELGALAAGAAPERAAAYGRMGRAYGLAFQVRDDVLGTWGTPAETGKPAGADIRRRKWSFPVAWAMSGSASPDRDTVAQAYASIGELAGADADAVIAALERLGAHDAADAACDAYIADAVATAQAHDLDRERRLANIFSSTARRTA
ncbi:MAG: polyprenyl synthetase family protein [Candidatus Eremiobacteraeota bacterium]|nr:polyprenyl synthetase family protein [Candidatus Eremiobacteraeota bacterium]